MSDRRKTTGIVVHYSKSNWGTEHDVDEWHKARGFARTGYHYVILNGQLSSSLYVSPLDGQVCPGRPEKSTGAHCPPRNRDSIGVCLISDGAFTRRQLHSLRMLCSNICKRYDFGVDDVRCHYEEQEDRTCPEINGDDLRDMLRGAISISELQRRIRAARKE